MLFVPKRALTFTAAPRNAVVKGDGKVRNSDFQSIPVFFLNDQISCILNNLTELLSK